MNIFLSKGLKQGDRRLMLKNCVLMVAVGLLAGCSTAPRLGGAPGLQVIDASEFPAPDRADIMWPGSSSLLAACRR